MTFREFEANAAYGKISSQLDILFFFFKLPFILNVEVKENLKLVLFYQVSTSGLYAWCVR